jgi:pSer/pThr/pTyr-binding forkhead associated (FHA) protein
VSAIVLKPVVGGEPLTITRDVVVGRNDACDVVLKSKGVSGKHARLCVKEGRLSVEDLGSTNGTFVNGERVAKPTPLENGDRVKFDAVEFDVVLPPSGDRTEIRAVPKPVQDKTLMSPPTKAPDAPAKAPDTPAKAPDAPKKQPDAPAIVAPLKPAAPSAAAGEGAPRPAAQAEAQAQGAKKAPGAWADPANRVKSKTMFIDKEELDQIINPEVVVPNTSLAEPHLQVLSGQSKGKNLLLRGAGKNVVWKVGSEPGQDGVKLDDQGVSAFHATIERKDNRWKVADQMSANGTFVNGAQVAVRFLSTGDKVKFGPVDCVFRMPQAAGARSKAMRLSFWPIALISFAITVALLWWFLR